MLTYHSMATHIGLFGIKTCSLSTSGSCSTKHIFVVLNVKWPNAICRFKLTWTIPVPFSKIPTFRRSTGLHNKARSLRANIYIYIITMTTTLSCTRRRDGHLRTEWFFAGKIFGHLESFYGSERYADEVRINYETHLQRKNHNTISMITLILCYDISIMSEIEYPKNP